MTEADRSMTVDAATLAAANTLCPHPPEQIEICAGGANSRIYRVWGGGASYALKRYPPVSAQDSRDRLGVETRALRLFARHGVAATPRLIAASPDHGYSLLEWVEGTPVEAVSTNDVDDAVRFLEQVHALSGTVEAADFPPASGACLSGAEIVRQIDGRLQRLTAAAQGDAWLARTLAETALPALEQWRAIAARRILQHGLDADAELPRAQRSLIPADFGFHNAIRRVNGQLAYIDFEYFGWDDPAKLVADFLLHPGTDLAPERRARFRDGCGVFYGHDPLFNQRLQSFLPLYACRWILIMLNIFLPHIRQARVHLHLPNEWEIVKEAQVVKIRRYIDAIDLGDWS